MIALGCNRISKMCMLPHNCVVAQWKYFDERCKFGTVTAVFNLWFCMLILYLIFFFSYPASDHTVRIWRNKSSQDPSDSSDIADDRSGS